jgi:hypothetical protein
MKENPDSPDLTSDQCDEITDTLIEMVYRNTEENPYDYSKWYSANDIYALAWSRALQKSVENNHPDWRFDEEAAHDLSNWAVHQVGGSIMGLIPGIDFRSSTVQTNLFLMLFTRLKSELLRGAVERAVNFNIELSSIGGSKAMDTAQKIFARAMERYIVWHELFFNGYDFITEEELLKVQTELSEMIKQHPLKDYIPGLDCDFDAQAVFQAHLSDITQRQK